MTFFIFTVMELIQQALAQGIAPAIVVVIYLIIVKINAYSI